MEDLRSELASFGIELLRSIYSNPDESLHNGVFNSNPATIRLQRIWRDCDISALDTEIGIMKALQHPQIVQIYDCFRVAKNQAEYAVVVMEFVAKTVQSDIEVREMHRAFLDETELWSWSFGLISAFAHMQRREFAHRNVNPDSLFITIHGVKIGNFRASKASPAVKNLLSLQGERFYQSPVLTDAFMRKHSTALHNPYKSDVYSLGLTLLTIAKLKLPQKIPLTGHIPEAISEEIQECQYSQQFKDFLYELLIVEEGKRGDFVDFEKWLGMNSASIPRSKSPDPLPGPEPPGEERKSVQTSLLVQPNQPEIRPDSVSEREIGVQVSSDSSKSTHSRSQNQAFPADPGEKSPSKASKLSCCVLL